MDELISTIIKAVLTGGPEAIVAILLAVIGGLVMELRRLRGVVQAKVDRIEVLVTQYHTGTISVAESMTELRLVLAEMRARL